MDDVNDHAAVTFVDVQRRLTLFAQGLAGRPLQLQPCEDAATRVPADGRTGRVAADEGDITLRLPAVVGDFAERRHNLASYRIAVLHQLGHLQEGRSRFSFGALAGRLALPRPQIGWTPEPPTELQRFFACARRPALLQRVFSTLEDLRIDAAMRRRYPGAAADLDRVLAQALSQRPALATLRPLAAALEWLLQFSLGADDPGASHEWIRDLAAPIAAASADVHDSAEAAWHITTTLDALSDRPLRRTAPPVPLQAPAAAEGGTDAPPGGGDPGMPDPTDTLVPEDFDGPGVAFRGEAIIDQPPRRRGAGVAGTAPQSDAPVTVQPPQARQNRSPAAGRHRTPHLNADAERAALEGPRSFYYDEWDCHRQRYLKGWCRLIEQRLAGEHAGYIDEVRRRHRRLAAQIRRRFGFVRPDAWQRVHRTPDGDELELDAVIDAVIDRRIGQPGEDSLYLRRERALREVATAFLVDMSASTDFPVPDPDAAPDVDPTPAPTVANDDDELPYLYGGYTERAPPPAVPRRRVIDVAKEAIALMGDALQALGDAHAIYGFSGDGRHQVECHIAKHFGEPWGPRAWAALAAMQPRRSTRTGPAIRHAVAKLARQPARTRLLIVISDGYPQDSDYGPDPNDADYGIADTARALQEAAQAGITAFCITIDPAGHDYLRRLCAETRYLVIEDVNTLPAALGKVYKALSTGGGTRVDRER